MPETGSLSRLQWFTILNTVLLALMAAESIVVSHCYEAAVKLKQLGARLKQVQHGGWVGGGRRTHGPAGSCPRLSPPEIARR